MSRVESRGAVQPLAAQRGYQNGRYDQQVALGPVAGGRSRSRCGPQLPEWAQGPRREPAPRSEWAPRSESELLGCQDTGAMPSSVCFGFYAHRSGGRRRRSGNGGGAGAAATGAGAATGAAATGAEGESSAHEGVNWSASRSASSALKGPDFQKDRSIYRAFRASTGARRFANAECPRSASILGRMPARIFASSAAARSMVGALCIGAAWILAYGSRRLGLPARRCPEAPAWSGNASAAQLLPSALPARAEAVALADGWAVSAPKSEGVRGLNAYSQPPCCASSLFRREHAEADAPEAIELYDQAAKLHVDAACSGAVSSALLAGESSVPIPAAAAAALSHAISLGGDAACRERARKRARHAGCVRISRVERSGAERAAVRAHAGWHERRHRTTEQLAARSGPRSARSSATRQLGRRRPASWCSSRSRSDTRSASWRNGARTRGSTSIVGGCALPGREEPRRGRAGGARPRRGGGEHETRNRAGFEAASDAACVLPCRSRFGW